MLHKGQQMLVQVLLLASKIVIGVYAYHCIKKFFRIRQIVRFGMDWNDLLSFVLIN
ncbi:hypothetical protein AusDCA_2497 [Desulfitobacterium sp. AusDCA]